MRSRRPVDDLTHNATPLACRKLWWERKEKKKRRRERMKERVREDQGDGAEKVKRKRRRRRRVKEVWGKVKPTKGMENDPSPEGQI